MFHLEDHTIINGHYASVSMIISNRRDLTINLGPYLDYCCVCKINKLVLPMTVFQRNKNTFLHTLVRKYFQTHLEQ